MLPNLVHCLVQFVGVAPHAFDGRTNKLEIAGLTNELHDLITACSVRHRRKEICIHLKPIVLVVHRLMYQQGDVTLNILVVLSRVDLNATWDCGKSRIQALLKLVRHGHMYISKFAPIVEAVGLQKSLRFE